MTGLRNGKALQAGTSHYMGTNFASAFRIQYLNQAGHQELCDTTSWGMATRMIGGVVMTHSDDKGLILPQSPGGNDKGSPELLLDAEGTYEGEKPERGRVAGQQARSSPWVRPSLAADFRPSATGSARLHQLTPSSPRWPGTGLERVTP